QAFRTREATALADVGRFPISFNPTYEKVVLHRVMLHRGGQEIDQLQAAKVRFLQREMGYDQGVFTGVVTATVLVDDLRVGDAMEVAYSVEGSNPVFGNRFQGGLSWDRNLPVEWRYAAVTMSKSRDIRWRVLSDALPTDTPKALERVEGAMRTFEFQERNIPAVALESNTPNDYLPARYVALTEYRDWSEVVRWGISIFPDVKPTNKEIDALVARLRALPGKAEQVAEALRWTQGEIRYLSLSLGENSHRPHAPDETVSNRYGDCKDKAYLLTSVLRQLGIDADPVLVSATTPRSAHKGPPYPLAFDHVIVRAVVDAKAYYLDATRLTQPSPLDAMGQGLEGADVLVLRPGVTQLEQIPERRRPLPPQDELVEKIVAAKFDEPATLEYTQTWKGLAAEYLRAAYARVPDSERARLALSGYDRRYPGASLESGPTARDDVQHNTFSLSARLRLPNALTKAGSDAWVLRVYPSNLIGAVPIPGSITRKGPLALPLAAQRYSVEVELPPEVAVVTDPSNRSMHSTAFDFDASYSYRGNRAKYTYELATKVLSVAAADLPGLMQDLRKTDELVRSVVVVRKEDIKSNGFLGLGRKTLQETVQARLKDRIRQVSAAIDSAKLSGSDLALAYSERASAQAELGQREQADKDIGRALQLAPDSNAILQTLGEIQFNHAEFAKSTASYTKALTLGADPAAVYYRRGISRFYLGQLDAAAADFAQASSTNADSSDRLYALLWQAWTLQRLNRPLPEALLQSAKAAKSDWPRPAVAMLAGLMSVDDMLHSIDKRTGDDLEMTQVEAYFYAGQYYRAKGDESKAREYFEKSRSKGVVIYIEHQAAGFELGLPGPGVAK
ncbi:MAG: DUF3857 domain-containing protein, partial [Betaproteobacteria bacterium]|nr:DUF3857 domain-containing protein [Betaproteobacteria bacterium]